MLTLALVTGLTTAATTGIGLVGAGPLALDVAVAQEGSAISKRYEQLGGARSWLGAPTGAEYVVAGVRVRDFSGGSLFAKPGLGVHEVHGDILTRYRSLGGPGGFLRAPSTDEVTTPGGRLSAFEGGSVYWSISTGAKVVVGDILGRYRTLGGSGGPLGLPVSDEYGVRGARAVNFQGGAIYWVPGSGTWTVQGDILRRYWAAGGPDGMLGLPLSDELAVPGGRATRFQGGTIFWAPGIGPKIVYGAILQKYLAVGASGSSLGLPLSEEYGVPGGRATDFQFGTVYWSPATGAWPVHGAIKDYYRAIGGPASFYGFPNSDEYDIPGGRQNNFQHGQIRWTPGTGVINNRAMSAVSAALSKVGAPYQYGAAGPNTFDCSGLMMWAWAHAGVALPHYSGAQYTMGRRVGMHELQPGDLVFSGSPISHVGMYIGDGRIVAATHTGDFVRIQSLRSDFFGAVRL